MSVNIQFGPAKRSKPIQDSSTEFILEYSSEMQESFRLFFDYNKTYDLIAKKQKMSVEPEKNIAIDLAHNHYLKSIYNLQLLKLSLIGDQIIQAIKSKNFLAYALAGRSLLEHVAVWRYFLVEKYAKIFKGTGQEITFEDFQELIALHRRFIYGTRFDWLSWINKDFTGLEAAYSQAAKDKKRKKNKKHQSPEGKSIQVNVLTCVEKLSSNFPKFGVYYDMFCGLVHPNFGSNVFLAGVSAKGGVVIDQSAEIHLGMKLIEETFSELVSLTYGQVNELTKSHFSMLLGEPPPNTFAIDFSKRSNS